MAEAARDTSSQQDFSLEDCIIRFKDLGERRSSYQPVDTFLPRFQRDRYSVVGRGSEGTTKGKKTAEVKDFSIVYLRVEAGKGIADHAHNTSEVFIPLSGRWTATVGDKTTTLEAWDVISVPPSEMHSLINISGETAYVMTVNSGQAGAPTYFHKDILDEVRAAGGAVKDIDYPPDAAPGTRA